MELIQVIGHEMLNALYDVAGVLIFVGLVVAVNLMVKARTQP